MGGGTKTFRVARKRFGYRTGDRTYRAKSKDHIGGKRK